MDLTHPCKGDTPCPFRTDCLAGWLGQDRAKEIIQALYDMDQTFQCHKTTGAMGSKATPPQHCAGAMILMEKTGKANQWMRIAERLGFYDRTKLDMEAPVFDTPDQFIQHHSNDRRKT